MTTTATSPIERYRRAPTEASMEAAIRDLVALRHGKVFHLRDARRAPELADLPDLIVLLPPSPGRPGLVALLELKSHRRPVTPGQAEVAGLVASAGRVVGGIVRANPREGELSYDDILSLLAP